MKNISLKYTVLILATLSILIMCSCTQNGGDIGDWFGTWKLKKITINDENDPAYKANIFWKFQSDIIQMQEIHDEVSYSSSIGTWEQPTSKILRLKYTYSDDITPIGEQRYAPRPATHLPSGVTDLDIITLNGKNLELRYINEGIIYKYYFDKY